MNKEMSDLEIKMIQPSQFFACGGHISSVLIKRKYQILDEKVSTFKIFHLRRARVNCFNKGNVRFWKKWFQPSQFFACGLISRVLIKEVSDPGMERVSNLKNFRLQRAHTMHFNGRCPIYREILHYI